MSTSDDPRAVRSREAILAAGRALLVEHGPEAVTHAQVADRAGVGRATVYRHWPRAHDLLSEVMAQVPFPFFTDRTSPTRAWLRASMVAIAEELHLVEVRAVATTLIHASQWDEALDARRRAFAETVAERVGSALLDAEAEGEVWLRVPASSAAAVLLGPLFYRATIERGSLDDGVVDASLDAIGTWSRPVSSP